MKIPTKKLALFGAATAVTLSTAGLVGMASADSSQKTSLVDKLVAKFHLNKADVQAVFDQEHTERQAEHLKNVQDKLATAVKDGKLSQEKADKIIAKLKEMQAQRGANHDKFESMTDAERKAAMQAEKDAFDKWVSDNGIPAEYARFAQGGRGGRGHMGPPPTDNAAK